MNVTLPPNDFLGDEVLRRALEIVDLHRNAARDPAEEDA